LIVDPDPELAPVIPPVIAPTVHVKLLAAEATKLIFGPVPLQVEAALLFIITGIGFTNTVMVNGAPLHDPELAVGVTT